MQIAEQQAYTVTREWHEDMVVRLQALRAAISKQREMGELCDMYYALRQIEELAADTAKECRLIMETLAKAVGAIFVQEALTNPNLVKIETPWCIGTPDVGTAVTLPSRKRDPEAYAALLKVLGVPDNLIGDENEVKPISVNWKGMVEYVSQMVAEGKPLPAGFDPSKTYSVYKLSVRKRKEVDAVV